ncbi:hypothetical protein N779_09470 [Vibrio coralliilyticus OCN008]|nr:hypothetical protein N779_09470 [Vibrio coralliilyticus OCN008]
MEPINNNNKLDNHHAYVVGMSGSGKSSLAKKLLIAATDQVAIYDPKREYDGKLKGRKIRVYTNLKAFASALLAGRETRQALRLPTARMSLAQRTLICSAAWFGAAGTASTKSR